MKIHIILFFLITRIAGNVIYDLENYGNCEEWTPFIKSTGSDLDSDCCNTKGIECIESKVISIDITVNSGSVDMTKLPSFKLNKFSIKGDLFKGIFPYELMSSDMYKILDLSNSSIKEIPEFTNYNFFTEEIYLNNNQISKFPFQLSNFQNLRVLNLDYNNITESFISSDLCNFFPNVELLSLDFNPMPDQQNFQCKQNKDYDDATFIIGVLGLLIFCILMVTVLIFVLLKESDNQSTHYTTHETYNISRMVRIDSEFLPDYNDVIKYSACPPSYTDLDDNSMSSSELSSEVNYHLPTYEETMEISLLHNNE